MDIAKFLRIALWWLRLIVPPQYSKVNWVACSLILRLHILSILIKNFHVAQIVLYYHVTKQFLPLLNWLVTCFWFQNIFRLSWKIYLKRCKSNYVISQVKRLSSSALGGWSGAFNFRVDVLCEYLVGFCKYTVTRGFLLVLISWYQRVEWKQMTQCYWRYI